MDILLSCFLRILIRNTPIPTLPKLLTLLLHQIIFLQLSSAQTYTSLYTYDRFAPENTYMFSFNQGDQVIIDLSLKCYSVKNVHVSIIEDGGAVTGKPPIYTHCSYNSCSIAKTINTTNTYFIKVFECVFHESVSIWILLYYDIKIYRNGVLVKQDYGSPMSYQSILEKRLKVYNVTGCPIRTTLIQAGRTMDYKLYDWTESGSWTSVATAMLVNGNYVLTYSLVAGKDYTYEIGSGLGTVYDLVPYKFVIEYDVDVGGCRNIAFMVDYYNKKIQYPCPQEKFYDSGSGTCLFCHFSCAKCQTAEYCTICNVTKIQAIAGGTCLCKNRFFYNGTSTCLACQYSCLTCTDGSTCTSCDVDKFRGLSTITNLCKCLVKYYNNGTNQLCVVCHLTCLMCSGSLISNCLSCNFTADREFNSSAFTCNCKSGFGNQSTVQQCSYCHVSCKQCVWTLSTNCSSCTFPRVISGSTCPCSTGYYDNPLNICTQCHKTCGTCNNATSCLTCRNTTNMTKNTTSGLCYCNGTLFWDQSTQICKACNFRCKTCASTSTSCTDCSTSYNRVMMSGSCICTDGQYDNDTANCVACPYQCMTCDKTGCLKCNLFDRRVISGLNCTCSEGYYDSGSKLCSNCNTQCKTCGTTNSKCLTCDGSEQFRFINGTTCSCMPGYFDSGLESKVCQKCLYKCGTCASVTCITCSSSTRNLSNSCQCSPRYFDDGSSAVCVSCHYSCLLCTNTQSCTQCDPEKGRTADRSSGRCKCMDRFLEDGTNQLCLSCHTTCLTCSDTTIQGCLTCNTTANRIYKQADTTCQCQIKYYQTSASVQFCSACYQTCLTCSGSLQTQCQTCSDSQNRVLNVTSTTNKKCLCKARFYLTLTFKCQPCYMTCATCSDSITCLTCLPGTTNNSIGQCQCPIGKQWNMLDSVCEDCDPKCKTCEVTTTNCTSCDLENSYRTKVGSSCVCIDGYFDNSVPVCQKCNHSCMLCDSSGCTLCHSNSYRTFVDKSCPCIAGYYDNNESSICRPCHSSCVTCVLPTSCLTCNTTLNKSVSPTTGLCTCMQKFYEDDLNLCTPCLYSCSSCSVGARCQTCNQTQHRFMNIETQLCECEEGFFDDGAREECQPCLYDCKSCTNNSQCTSCDKLIHHRLMNTTSNRCVCMQKYFESPVPNTTVCPACLYSCLTCTSLDKCTTVNPTSGRTIKYITNNTTNSTNNTTSNISSSNTTSNTNSSTSNNSNSSSAENQLIAVFVCQDGTYDDGVNQQCVKCHYSCLICMDGVSCISCNLSTFRKLLTICVCNPLGYYQEEQNPTCKRCHYSCYTCEHFHSCSSCNLTHFYRIFDDFMSECVCVNGYYDNGTQNQLCVKCPYQCDTCSPDLKCTDCNIDTQFRFLEEGDCVCLIGYYDDGTNHSVCSKCHYSCQTCLNGLACTSCNLVNFRSSNPTTSLCSCINRYFDDQTNNQICQPCYYTCLTCQVTQENCTSCHPSDFRIFLESSHECTCKQGYFDNYVSVCQPCHYSCLSCLSASSCEQCNSSMNRQYNPDGRKCKCISKYFQQSAGNAMCIACEQTCFRCNNLNECTLCQNNNNRILNRTANFRNITNLFCPCFYKYFPQADPSQPCLACHYSCGECSGEKKNSCLFCSSDAKRVMNSTTSSCNCMVGFFDNGFLETCIPCHGWCLDCFNHTNYKCTKCQSAYYFHAETSSCLQTCPDFFFNQKSTMTCKSCPDRCKKCINSSMCIQCEVGYPLYNSQCQNQCPMYSTYNNLQLNQCKPCPNTCPTCTSHIRCTSCIETFYLDEILFICINCHQTCKKCTNPAYNACSDCVHPLFLRNNSCVNLTCKAGQSVHPLNGCSNCKELFTNSIDCTINEALHCQPNYILENGRCVYCDDVYGYKITRFNTCSEICGDGLIIKAQCDDGNILNGDGCASNCMIQQGWKCIADQSNTSSCFLINNVHQQFKINLKSAFKFRGENRVRFDLSMSSSIKINPIYIQIRVLVKNISRVLSLISEYDQNYLTDWFLSQNDDNLKQFSIELNYTKHLQKLILQISYKAQRLTSGYNVEFLTQYKIQSFPPVLYTRVKNLKQMQGLRNTIYYGCIVLMCLCALCLLFPKKLYEHLSFVVTIPGQIYIYYGLLAEKNTEFVQLSVSDIQKLAFVLGFRIPFLSNLPSTPFMGYSLQTLKTSGMPICIILTLWTIFLIAKSLKMYYSQQQQYNLKLMKIYPMIKYLILTAQICVLPHMGYASVNGICRLFVGQGYQGQGQGVGRFYFVVGGFVFCYLTAFVCYLFKTSRGPIQPQPSSQSILPQSQAKQLTQLKKYLHYRQRWDILDYLELYRHRCRQNQNSNSNQTQNYKYKVQTKMPCISKYANAKYYIPVSYTKILLSCSIAALSTNQASWVGYALLVIVNAVYLIYVGLCWPYKVVLSNLRVIFLEVIFGCVNVLMAIQAYNLQHPKPNSQTYNPLSQKPIIVAIAILIWSAAIMFCLSALRTLAFIHIQQQQQQQEKQKQRELIGRKVSRRYRYSYESIKMIQRMQKMSNEQQQQNKSRESWQQQGLENIEQTERQTETEIEIETDRSVYLVRQEFIDAVDKQCLRDYNY